MTTKMFLENTKNHKRYEVLAIDKEAGTITLKGSMTKFTEVYDPKRFKEMGYVPKQVEVDDDA